MKVLDLFSGIGGFSLGLEAAGMETLAFCEIDGFCKRVLAERWPNLPIHNDIRTLKGDTYGSADLICGGFPCQPYSHAGLRKGTDDDRYLWPETLRVIDEADAHWFVGENVTGLLSMGIGIGEPVVESRRLIRTIDEDYQEVVFTRQEAMLLDRICDDLEKIGYEVIPFVVPACGLNAPHRRDRIWIVAYSQSKWARKCQQRDRAQGIVAGQDAQPVRSAATIADTTRERCGETWQFLERSAPWSTRSLEVLADTKGLRLQRGGEGSPHRIANLSAEHDGSPEGEPRRWDLPSSRVCRGDDGVPDRLDRTKALGNAVVPQVVHEFGWRIKFINDLLTLS